MSFQKGQKVFTRKMYGNERGQVDTSRIWIIRSIGTKRAILDRVNEQLAGYRHGNTYYKYTHEEVAERYGNGYITDWSQAFVLIGEEGFDTKENYS